MRRASFRSLAWAGTVAACLAAPLAHAEKVTLTPQEMRAAATYALEVHDNALALKLAGALLQRTPDDGFALITQSRAARNLGQNDLALSSARQAWGAAESRADRYAAALVMAQALSSAGHRTRAQIWLRRAAQNAPNEQLKAVVARDFRYVRSRNPWSTQLSFGIAPSSNINNGSKSDTMVIGGLPFVLSGGAQALSGMEYSLGAETRYRMQLSDRVQLNFGAAFESKSYTLSDSAKRKAPGLKGSDLAYQAAQLSMGADFAQKNGIIGIEATFGQSYYGGAQLADFARLDLHRRLRLGERSALSFSVSAEDQWRKDRAIKSASTYTGQLGWQHLRTNGDKLGLSVGLRDVQSDSADIAHSAQLAAIGYSFGKPVLGAKIGINFVYEARDYDRRAFGSPPRQDDKLTLGATAVLPKLDVYGFAPEISISAVRNKSSLSLYDSEDLNMTLGFRSAF